MKLKTIQRSTEICESKLFGECYVPDKWLEENIFSPFEFFVAQINLSEISCDLLPSKGYLYFFVDAYSFNFNKLSAKVRYYEEEPDAYTDFNDGYFEENPDEYFIEKDDQGEIIFCENSCNEKIVLLQIKNHFLPEELKSATFSFEIDKNSLKSGLFEKCVLKLIK